jgi:uncharacterized protein
MRISPVFAAAFLCAAAAPQRAAAIPNPASVYCGSIGGRTELVTGPGGGVRGLCVLPDGRRVDEWALFRARGRRR